VNLFQARLGFALFGIFYQLSTLMFWASGGVLMDLGDSMDALRLQLRLTLASASCLHHSLFGKDLRIVIDCFRLLHNCSRSHNHSQINDRSQLIDQEI